MASDLFDKVLTCPTLPSLPAVAVEVLRVTRDRDARLTDIAKVVQNDASLSAKLLKTVNSSLYGLKERCTRIDRALGFMGMNTVKSIVLGISLVDGTRHVNDAPGFDMNLFWRKTLCAAAAARQIAIATRLCDPDEAFTAGLFHDIGILAAVTALKSQYASVFSAATDPSTLAEVEKEHLGFDHMSVGGELATRWSLPQQYVDCIRHHHNAVCYSGSYPDMVRTVALAGFIADALSNQNAGRQMARFRSFASKWFPQLLEDDTAILNASGADAKELGKLFDKNVGHMPDVTAIMAEVQELSIEHQLAVQQEAEQLRQVNLTLSEQSLTDTLTKIGNRRRFDSVIASAIATADQTSPARPVSVLFVDADRFKSVNDTHGHAVGDAVLVELAKRLTETIRDSGLTCRFGGEEFVVLLPDVNAAEAAAVAERVRDRVASVPFDTSAAHGPSALPVTISIGVATRTASGEGPLAGVDPERLLKAADEAVYAAKQAGRNCVRVTGADRRSGNAPVDTARLVAATASQSPTSAATAKAALRVMVVEKDPLAAALLRACLQRQGKIDAFVLESTDAALAVLRSPAGAAGVPSVIVCDCQSGRLHGTELARILRDDSALRHISVLLISNDADAVTDQRLNECGAREFVTKSVLSKDLVGWVARILSYASPVAKAA